MANMAQVQADLAREIDLRAKRSDQYQEDQERIWILHEKYFVIIRSSGFCAALSIHTHLLELHCLRGSTTKKKTVVLKFLELSLSTMPPSLR
jgi:hypothetical protein